MSADDSHRLDPGDAFRFVAIGVVVIIFLFIGWEFVEREFGDSEELVRAMHYARGISTSIVVGFVIYLLAFRRERDNSASLRLDLKDRTEEATASESLLDSVMDASPSAMLVIDKDHKLIKANRVARQIHGDGLEKLFTPDCERCAVCTGCETLATGRSEFATRELVDPKTGAVLAISSHPTILRDGSTAAVIVEQVVTHQKKLQAGLLHQEKMAAFGMVAAGVAHEMGNPLSSIEMHLQLIDDSALNEDDSDSIKTLRKETARLRRTLRELVDFARRRRSEPASVSVGSVIGDALQLLRYDPRMRYVDVVVESSPDIPAVFMVEDHLMQVLVNLIINALDAMPERGTLRIDTRHVGKLVSLRVRDTGTGMSTEDRGRCFEALFTTKEPGKGTGLGLTICREVIEAAGGTIEIHSAPGKGTTVVVSLPQDAAETRHSGQRASLPLVH